MAQQPQNRVLAQGTPDYWQTMTGELEWALKFAKSTRLSEWRFLTFIQLAVNWEEPQGYLPFMTKICRKQSSFAYKDKMGEEPQAWR